jgi:hypothetical protein
MTARKRPLNRGGHEVVTFEHGGIRFAPARQDRRALAAALHRYLDANPIAGRRW